MYNQFFNSSKLVCSEPEVFYPMPVQPNCGPLLEGYLCGIDKTLVNALNAYPRTCAIRFDLRISEVNQHIGSNVISRFTDSLKAHVKADLNRKGKSGKCKLRYVWAKEQSHGDYPHYHFVLLLNGNVYNAIGRYNADKGNMAAMINSAWASALGLTVGESLGLIHFPDNAVYMVNRNQREYLNQISDLFFRLSYLAKVDTKVFGDGSNNFYCSIK
jgi:hypothetical protein